MVTFILNNEQVSTNKPTGSSLLDFIRYDMGLTGTKAGCREGDCGACTVLTGTPAGDKVIYKSTVSCLMPLGNAHGKHIVTIEGLNKDHLSYIQQALVDNGAIQCGFCTPGIVMSLTAESLSARESTKESVIDSLSGNICRCTGYKSIERAAEAIVAMLKEKDINDPVRWMVEHDQLPQYFLDIPARLSKIPEAAPVTGKVTRIAGGTDLMLQKAETLCEADIASFNSRGYLKGIMEANGKCIIGAAVTFSETGQSEILKKHFPALSSCMRQIASEPVRNMATIGGNICNASPIGDMSVILLALGAEVTITGRGSSRTIPLKKLFLGYKKLNLSDDEYLSSVVIRYEPEPLPFSFEKISRRAHLDIASVNSAIQLSVNKGIITVCHLSAGGVSPVPLCLEKTGTFLTGKPVTTETIMQAAEIMQEEISPISDVRGSEEYKRLLLRQLLIAHFMKLFPDTLDIKIDKL